MDVNKNFVLRKFWLFLKAWYLIAGFGMIIFGMKVTSADIKSYSACWIVIGVILASIYLFTDLILKGE